MSIFGRLNIILFSGLHWIYDITECQFRTDHHVDKSHSLNLTWLRLLRRADRVHPTFTSWTFIETFIIRWTILSVQDENQNLIYDPWQRQPNGRKFVGSKKLVSNISKQAAFQCLIWRAWEYHHYEIVLTWTEGKFCMEIFSGVGPDSEHPKLYKISKGI